MRDRCGGVEHVFAVIERNEQALAGEIADPSRASARILGSCGEAERCGDPRLDEFRIGERGEFDPPHAVRKLPDYGTRRLERKARFSDTAHARQGDEARLRETELQRGRLGFASVKAGKRKREIVSGAALDGCEWLETAAAWYRGADGGRLHPRAVGVGELERRGEEFNRVAMRCATRSAFEHADPVGTHGGTLREGLLRKARGKAEVSQQVSERRANLARELDVVRHSTL